MASSMALDLDDIDVSDGNLHCFSKISHLLQQFFARESKGYDFFYHCYTCLPIF